MFMNVLCEDPQRASVFYLALFELRVAFESEWFMHLAAQGNEGLELGLLRRDHETIPEGVRSAPRGTVLSVVVEDVDAVHERAKSLEPTLAILEAPRDLFYGQRRMLLRAPEGTLIDVSSACPPDPEWMTRVAAREDGGHVERPPS